jgi:hypothetical protein
MCQAATLSPLFFFSPAILSRAALYTCGVVGSLSYVGATARYVSHSLRGLEANLYLETINIYIWADPYWLASQSSL